MDFTRHFAANVVSHFHCHIKANDLSNLLDLKVDLVTPKALKPYIGRCYDARILAEYREVLLRPRFQFNPEHVASLLGYIQHVGQAHPTQPLPKSLPDPDDDPFLEVALSGKVCCLVTGNKFHFPSRRVQGVMVFSPTDFLKYYRKTKGS